jgi:uncharacterized protein YprB with RNaseH-like and TPR domain
MVRSSSKFLSPCLRRARGGELSPRIIVVMIRNTFSIVYGIGEKLEKRLWRNGILTWRDFIEMKTIPFFSQERKSYLDALFSEAEEELGRKNAFYFTRTMKRRAHWRLYEVFCGEAVCLDIETNGLQPGGGGYITVVGLYDGYDWKALVAGENLTSDNLNKALSGYKYLITYYGASFDVPFLQRAFPEVKFDIPHFDLCYAARELGFRGGLKKLETSLGIERDKEVRGMDGYDAVRLWQLARREDGEARRLLLTYNREDTVNLMGIARVIYPLLRQSTGIEGYLSCGAY